MAHSALKVQSVIHKGCTYYFYDDLPYSTNLTVYQSNSTASSFSPSSSPLLSSSPISSPPLSMTHFENRIESQWRKGSFSFPEPIMHNQPPSPMFFPPLAPTGRSMAGHRPHMGMWTQPLEPNGLWNQPMVPMGTWNQPGAQNFLVPPSTNWAMNMHQPVVNQVAPHFTGPQSTPTPLMRQTIPPPRQTRTQIGPHQTTRTGPHQTTRTGPHQTTRTGPHQTTRTGPHQTTRTGPHQTIRTGPHRNPGASAVWAHDRRAREELQGAERITAGADGFKIKIKSDRKEFVSEVHYLPCLPRVPMEDSNKGNLHGESLSGFPSPADNEVRTMFKSLTM